MRVQDVDSLLAEHFDFLLGEARCPFQAVLLESVRSLLDELDGLDRDHPIWSLLAVETVNLSRLRSFAFWQLHHGVDREATDWTIVALDLAAGSVVSSAAWTRLAARSSAWRLEWVLAQGLFNWSRFGPGLFLADLARWLREREQMTTALNLLRPSSPRDLAFAWLAPDATATDIAHFADLIEHAKT